MLDNSFKAFLCGVSLNSTPERVTLLLMSKHKQIYRESTHLRKQLGTNIPLLNFHMRCKAEKQTNKHLSEFRLFKEPT